MNLEEALAIIENVRSIIFAASDKEATSHPWWAIVKKGGFGRYVVLEGPFFSRERAEELLEARRYAYGKTASVYCFSGYYSSQYKELRELLKPKLKAADL